MGFMFGNMPEHTLNGFFSFIFKLPLVMMVLLMLFIYERCVGQQQCFIHSCESKALCTTKLLGDGGCYWRYCLLLNG